MYLKPPKHTDLLLTLPSSGIMITPHHRPHLIVINFVLLPMVRDIGAGSEECCRQHRDKFVFLGVQQHPSLQVLAIWMLLQFALVVILSRPVFRLACVHEAHLHWEQG